MASPDKPLVSFTLLGYNQEHFIREAIAGALAQTYSPLEIILSDDCSTDSTFKIMQEMAEAYKGPHKIVVTRTPKNLGCGGHVSAVMEMAQGEFIIRADGDDISLPERSEVLTEAWLEKECPSGIGSGVITINENGERLDVGCPLLSPLGHPGGLISPPELIRLFSQEKPLGVVGCCGAWSKENWNFFGGFAEGVQQEDTVLSFRAFLYGGLHMVNQKLVKYRAHQENATFSLGHKKGGPSSFAAFKSQALRVAVSANRRHAEFVTIRADIATAKVKLKLDYQTLGELEASIDRRIAELAVRKEWWLLGFFGRLRHWRSAPYAGWQQRIPSLLGLSGFALIRYLVVRLKKWFAPTTSLKQNHPIV
jgi:glycosyltransferase involved in cell wall biosynthesis